MGNKNEYIGTAEAAKLLRMTSRRVVRLCGEGRFDLQLEPKDKILPGILMEFKAVSASEKDKLPELAEEALVQTEDKNDQRDLEERGVSAVVRYGIAFSGKNVEVRMAR
jgi:hypothetical protein